MRVYEPSRQPVVAVAFSPDGRRLVAGCSDTLRIWHVTGDGPPVVGGHGCFRRVAFTPDGRSCIADGGEALSAVDADTGEWAQLAHPNGRSWTFTLDPAGRVAVYCNVDFLANDLQWYSFADGGWVDEWAGLGPSGGWVLRFSPDGKRLALPSYRRLVLYDVVRRSSLADVELPEGPQVLLAYSPDGTRIVCGAGRRLVAFDAATLAGTFQLADCPAVVAELRSGRHHFSDVAFHPSGRFLAATSHDGTVRLYDVATWREAQAYDWGIGKLKCVAFSPDGTLGAVGSESGQVVVWDVEG